MSQLIITIIAIALGAATLTSGVYYGGEAFMRARMYSQAVTLVAKAGKVGGALQNWAQASGTHTLTDTNWSDGTATDLVPTYLDALSTIGPYAQGNGSTDNYFKTMPLANVQWANEGVNFDSLIAIITDSKMCQAIARLAGSSTSTPLYRNVSGSTMGDFSANMAANDFQCVVNDANNNSVIDSGEYMFFIYKVF